MFLDLFLQTESLLPDFNYKTNREASRVEDFCQIVHLESDDRVESISNIHGTIFTIYFRVLFSSRLRKLLLCGGKELTDFPYRI